MEAAQEKTEKQLRAEAKKAEKLAKFEEKKKKAEELEQKKKAEQLDQQKNEGGDAKPKRERSKKVEGSILYEKSTPPGEKKDVSGQMPDSYSPRYVEAQWYSWWEKEGFFKPEYGRDPHAENPKGRFVMVIPPPNVTGALHIGHALTSAVEDALTRWHRMNGKTVLWNPGSDHAGIATQVVVEKKIAREQGKTRHDLGREKFIEIVQQWKDEKVEKIYHQLRALGCSVDFSRAVFTMDPKMSRAVTEAFCRLHEDKLIYRANRLVNWSCRLNSAISDVEVDKIELTGRTMLSVPGYEKKVEFGVLISFAYRLEDSEDEIVVATTRIETMLGDSAIAVHPDDERYREFVGKFVVHPFVDRKLPIISDTFVDMEFGTGAVKVTPAHDHNDYAVGKKHRLPFINILEADGKIREGCGRYSGMRRFDARIEVLADLKDLSLYRGTKENPMVVPVCSRSQDIVEPVLKPQWYISCKNLASDAIKAVREGRLKIIPEQHVKTWNWFLENIQDWCISRQLWWGHRVPAYYVSLKGGVANPKGARETNDYWVCGRSEEDARNHAAHQFGVDGDQLDLEQDEDVLDTWFSSGLFPFSIFGWPERTADLEAFYPGQLLETGHDIIFFWVARMVMLGSKLLGKLPFKEVLMHSIIRDAHGRKMSKSLGNVIDPIDVIRGITLEELNKTLESSNLDAAEIKKAQEGQRKDYPKGIPECGTDALRFALCSYMTQGRDINLDINRVEGYRFFCNKLWNAFKFALLYLGTDFKPSDGSVSRSSMDKWILSRLTITCVNAHKGFSEYDFPAVTTACYSFWLYDLCDLYLESLKPVFQSDSVEAKTAAAHTLHCCLETGIRLLHPFMPFITEELWQRLPRKPDDPVSICVAAYPSAETIPEGRNEQLEKDVASVLSIIHKVRSVRSDYNLTKAQKVDLYIKCAEAQRAMIEEHATTISTLTTSSSCQVTQNPPPGCAINTVGTFETHLLLKGVVDVEKEKERLSKQQVSLKAKLQDLEGQMALPGYADNAPQKVHEANLAKKEDLSTELERIAKSIDSLKLIG